MVYQNSLFSRSKWMEDKPKTFGVVMNKHLWKEDAACLDYDTNLFFDKYEDNPNIRHGIDNVCLACPVARTCFAVGISEKEYGIWGGVYLERGSVSREFNNHKTKARWAEIWENLTIEG